jgi:hypothetical protein
MKKIILSELQIKNLVNKLVLNEQNVVVGQKTVTNTTNKNKVFPTTQLGDKFEFGQYDSPNVKTTIESLKPQIESFIKDSDSREFTVNIVAGESQVTNPKGFETKGSLALARANSVKKYLQEIFPDLIKNGVLKIVSPTDVSQVKIGETPYGGPKSGDNKNPEKIKLYKNEQFVNFNIVGGGTKNVTNTTTTNLICDFVTIADGGFSSPQYDSLYNFDNKKRRIPVSDLPDGSKIRIIFNTYFVPDLLTIQMGDFSYNSGFIGNQEFETELATILGNTYIEKGKEIPDQFPKNIYKLSSEDARSYLKQMKKQDYIDSFSHIFPTNQLPKMNNFSVYSFTGKITQPSYIKTLDKNKKGIQSYGVQENGLVLDLIKKTGDTELIMSVYSPIGSTRWKLETKCI